MGSALGWPPSGLGSAGQWVHPLAGEGLGEADRVAGGLADVGVVEEPVDGGGGQGLGHELVEGCWVQVRRDRDGAFLVAGVDQPVEALGGVGGDREQPDVIDLCGYPHRSIYADTATMPNLRGDLGVAAAWPWVGFGFWCRHSCSR